MGERGPKHKFSEISCPNEYCRKYGICGDGNIVGNGTHETKGGTVRKFICKECGRNFNSRTGTAYEGLRSPHREMDIVVMSLNEGLGIRATSRVTKHTPQTVMRWLERAEIQCRRVGETSEIDLPSENIQMDELWTVVKKTSE